ncbi:phage tail protein [Escherichia coli]|uniref:phage tail-collar fiber domain-containing protein n=1 Tax=Escherichia coli TaxID=562 RepID=UPI00092E51F3|nr:phage tail protein [Escherichia coli]EEV6021255.1 phage tail protein [Escherichia coli]EEV6991662.1 phage tail protein [Escherichia coli]EEW5340439.1 phage tail protein [Escherichia coli]EFA4351897.1 phage tail protein [Escherichia coli]EFA4747783.1 phage tail protein [Escherichia coli]
MHGLVLTTAGAAEIEAAYHAGEVVTISQVMIGDGGGKTLPSTPDEMAAMVMLCGEFGREPFSGGVVDEGFISGDIVIDCQSYPGKTLRELGMVSRRGTLIAYGRYPDTYLPAQTDSVIKEVILTLVLALTHTQSVTLNVDPHRAIITQEAGDKRYLRISENLADVKDRDEAVENLGLKPTVDKAKNAVQRDGDTMTGKLTLPQTSGFGVNTDNALGGNSIALGDNDTGIKQNGDGILDVYANGQHVFRFQNGVAMALKNIQAGNGRMFTLSSSDSSTKNVGFNLWGNPSRPVVAELGDDSGWHFYSQRNTDGSVTFAVNGQMTPSNYANFDARYQTKTGGVQNFQYTSEVFYNPGGNELSWTFRAPSGCTLSGILVQDTGRNSADNIGGVYYKQAQIYINGAWRSVSG